MTQQNFEFGDLAAKPSAEQRLFDECVRQTVRGRRIDFPLVIRETARIPFVPDDSHPAMIVERELDVHLVIPVLPMEGDALVIRSRKAAGPGKERRMRVWVGETFAVDVGSRKPEDMGFPEYIAKTAVEWIEAGVDAALKAGEKTWDGIRELDGDMREALSRISVVVDETGTPSLAQEQDVPRFLLVPDPIMGKKHFYSLTLTEARNTAWMDEWMREFLTFPLGDYEGAASVRMALVRQHCPKFDDGYGYEQMDARVEYEEDIVSRHDFLLALDPSDESLAAGIREFGRRFAMALPSGVDARKDILMTLREAPDEEDVIEACDAAQRKSPDVYSAFLEAAGWDFPFDPLDIVALKRRYAMGLPLDEKNAPKGAKGGPQL
ncbi:hypothetical protein [Rhizobium sp. BK176]|uniref:hypothetical protein n=1 Tax=Rhizobium sp. BK176 TaxID=2587071 RepID=UPI002166E0AC|nr:hypothetical protein [Rhizobium sp. BK176]MCS4088623.1 hypothetical protein [Rhizobium sp. BK176]